MNPDLYNFLLNLTRDFSRYPNIMYKSFDGRFIVLELETGEHITLEVKITKPE